MVQVKVEVDEKAIENRITNLIDDTTMLMIHKLLAMMCDPYVPFDTGVLSQTLEITPEWVRYNTPYAHYMYMGLVYGQNIPIIRQGQLVGFFSRPGVTKTPTGDVITYNRSKHPLATAEWDKAMFRDRQEEFLTQVQAILYRRGRQLYG